MASSAALEKLEAEELVQFWSDVDSAEQCGLTQVEVEYALPEYLSEKKLNSLGYSVEYDENSDNLIVSWSCDE